MQSFLDAYTAMEEYTGLVNEFNNEESEVSLKPFREQMEILGDYKQNTWMCVASMCIALSTTCFFLFILPIAAIRQRTVAILAIIDLGMFSALPILLTLRIFIVEQLQSGFGAAMRMAHKITSAERVMNVLQCTVLPREKVRLLFKIISYSLGTL